MQVQRMRNLSQSNRDSIFNTHRGNGLRPLKPHREADNRAETFRRQNKIPPPHY